MRRVLVLVAVVLMLMGVIPAAGVAEEPVVFRDSVTFEDVDPAVPSLSFFVRGGYYTHHVSRQDELTVLGGVSVDYDLGAIQ